MNPTMKQTSLTIKICVLGRLGVGKTTLISKYVKAKREQHKQTIRLEGVGSSQGFDFNKELLTQNEYENYG